MEIDINECRWYFSSEEFKTQNERTKKRLEEIKLLGLEEVGDGQFGIPGIMSGLYVERVWDYSEESWKDYIDFINDVKRTKLKIKLSDKDLNIKINNK